jgi:hypothetical protein
MGRAMPPQPWSRRWRHANEPGGQRVTEQIASGIVHGLTRFAGSVALAGAPDPVGGSSIPGNGMTSASRETEV